MMRRSYYGVLAAATGAAIGMWWWRRRSEGQPFRSNGTVIFSNRPQPTGAEGVF